MLPQGFFLVLAVSHFSNRRSFVFGFLFLLWEADLSRSNGVMNVTEGVLLIVCKLLRIVKMSECLFIG